VILYSLPLRTVWLVGSAERLKFDSRREVKSKVLSIPRTMDVEDIQFFMCCQGWYYSDPFMHSTFASIVEARGFGHGRTPDAAWKSESINLINISQGWLRSPSVTVLPYIVQEFKEKFWDTGIIRTSFGKINNIKEPER